jgi:hypothetical protein
MITPRSVCRLWALLALVTANLAGQTGAHDWNAVRALAPGTSGRITVGARTIRGTINRTTDEALVITSGAGQESIDRQQVSTVSVQQPSHRKRNALIGLAAGTGVGLGIGVAARPKSNQLQIVSSSTVVAAATVAGALVGTIVGVVIPTGGWKEIYRK